VIAGTSAYILHQIKKREISAKSISSHLPVTGFTVEKSRGVLSPRIAGRQIQIEVCFQLTDLARVGGLLAERKTWCQNTS
jgi:hypothetical protein